MASLKDIEATAKPLPSAEPAVIDESDPYEATYQDIVDAISLLSKCQTLFDYVTDPDLCKSVTKRELGSMERLREKITDYLNSVVGTYEEGPE